MIFKLLEDYVSCYPSDTAIYIGLDIRDNIIMQFDDDNKTRITFSKEEFYRIFDVFEKDE